MRLEEFEAKVAGKKCFSCGQRLPGKIDYYEHSDGWEVEGFSSRLWLYVECSKCGYQSSLETLGVPRKGN